jgi:predicted DsbA family dithiol-disulfide isomerase
VATVRRNKKYMREKQIEKADLLEIIYYTDPLCCWSWGFEPQWRRLLYEFSGRIKYRYCMGGLLPEWKNYHDTVNSVTRPIQMGPVWMHAKEISGMPIDQNIWMRDPPSSSYPCCIAVKCAALQSAEAEEKYLRLLREALMIEGINISRQQALLGVAKNLADAFNEFDLDRFKDDLNNDNGLEAFRKDLQEAQYLYINRFPTLVIKNENKKGMMISGYRSYTLLMNEIQQITNFKLAAKIGLEKYKEFWPALIERELQEII